MICGRCGTTIDDQLIRGPIKCRCGRWLERDGLPRWVKAIAAWRQPGDSGIGDTFERLASAIGVDRITRLVKWFGIDCGCERRRDKWNDHYPYDESGRVR